MGFYDDCFSLVIQQLIDSSLKSEPRVSNGSVTVFQHFDGRRSEPSLIPDSVPTQKLSDVKQKLKTVFMANDTDGDGYLSLKEFEIFLLSLNVKMTDQEVRALLKEIIRKHEDEITFQEYYQYFENMINGQKAIHTQSELDLLSSIFKSR